MDQLKNLLVLLVRPIVDEPDRVEVEASESENRVELALTVAPDDVGKVIGRGGRTIRAIRTVIKAASVNAGKRVSVEVSD